MSLETPTMRPAAPAAVRPLPNVVGFVLTIAMVWLGGQFVTQGVSDHLLASDPELAVLWRGDSADAVAVLARQRLVGHDRVGAARLASRALQLAPLNASALTTYGFAMDQVGRQPQADRAMTIAGRLGWRDVVTQIWLFRRELLAGDFEAALDHGDALMRRQNEVPRLLLAALTAAARDPRMIDPLARRMALSPNWREPFLVFLSYDAQPPATDVARALLARLAAGPTPPTSDELAAYLRRLVGDQKFDQAASDWRQLAHGAGQNGYVYDGDFERPPAATPFDWTMSSGVGWSVDIDAAPAQGRGQALDVQYDGVSPPTPVRQMLVLPPGSYRLSGRSYSQGAGAPRMLAWGIVCATSGQVLATVPTPQTKAQWTQFAAQLDVPAERCPAQWLALTAEPGDVRADIDVWYDDIKVAPTSLAVGGSS